MKTIVTSVLAAALAALAGGCASSPPSQFYRLTSVAPAQAPAAADALRSPVLVAAVHIPASLDREEIVRSGPGSRLELSGLNRWGAPLDEMIQRVLTQDLIERLPAASVVLPSGPSPAGTGRIVLDLLAFQSDVDGRVRLEGSWSLVKPGASAPALIHNVRYDETTAAGNFGAEAEVMSEMLGHLADDIARSLASR